jgi:1-aminocyclopropane-1-carboxylate deaminase/D-cysteine desulfhydrase-like pyridoxal-dependent ACC family enzyme
MSVESSMLQLTPVSVEAGYQVKRDDLFSISHSGGIRGGKLRQCLLLLQGKSCSRLISAGSIHSPQLAIVAYVAQHFGLPCSLFVGGRQETASLAIARNFGADVIRCCSGRHTVLFAEARRFAEAGDFLVPFGMRPNEPDRQFYETCAAQVRNIPANTHTIVIASGSGVTATIVAYGLWKEHRTDVRIAIVNVGPDRRRCILETLRALEPASAEWAEKDRVLRVFSVGQAPGFRYESPAQFHFGRVTLHPLYEAKAFRWFSNHVPFDTAHTLFWVTGPPLAKSLHERPS